MSDEIIIITPSTEDIVVNSSQGGAVGPAGPPGPTGNTGATGPAGTNGTSGVISVTEPITNSGTSTSAQIGLNQSALSIANTQVSGLGTASTKDVASTGDASSVQVVKGNDTRLSNSRTPTAHASTHGVAGSDPVTVASSQVTGLATSATTDTTNASNITLGTLPNARLVSVPDSALATITTASKVSNSATTATDASTALAIVARDASGNFSAGTITASLTGNASTATKLATARNINGQPFDGTAPITVTATPTAGTVVDASIDTAGLAQSSLTSNVIADWAASTSYARNALVNYLGVAYRRISAGTSGATFDPANWNAQTPALSVVASNITGIAPGSVTGTAVVTGDPRLSDSRTPSGSASGDLTGTYPGPTLVATGTAGTYTKVTTDSKGRVTSGTTLSATDVPTLDATQVTGTAYTKANKVVDEYRLANTFDIIPRTIVQSTRSLTNGTIFATLFTPQDSFTMTNFSSYAVTGGTDTGGTTIRRMGLFTVSGTTLTLVARTASDATLWNTTNTLYTRALSTVGGFPSTYTLNAGTTYAFGVIAYNTGGTFNAPSISASTSNTQIFQPYGALGVASQTELPTAPTAMSALTANQVFARLT